MKKFILAIALSFTSIGFAHAEGVDKKVCITQTDAKTKKSKEVCKVVKQHKKLDGTAIPEKK